MSATRWRSSVAVTPRDRRRSFWRRPRVTCTCWSGVLVLARRCHAYLSRRIEENPAISCGRSRRSRRRRGRRQARTAPMAGRANREPSRPHPIGHLFVMAGAVPNTSWMDGCVILDEKELREDGRGTLWRSLRARSGLSCALRICSKRAGQASLRLATSAAAMSSGLRPPWAKVRLRSRSFTRYCASRRSGQEKHNDERERSTRTTLLNQGKAGDGTACTRDQRLPRSSRQAADCIGRDTSARRASRT